MKNIKNWQKNVIENTSEHYLLYFKLASTDPRCNILQTFFSWKNMRRE